MNTLAEGNDVSSNTALVSKVNIQCCVSLMEFFLYKRCVHKNVLPNIQLSGHITVFDENLLLQNVTKVGKNVHWKTVN